MAIQAQVTTSKRKISGAGWVVIGLIGLLGLGLAALFGYQTWELVNFLLPSDALLMKILAVISFDGFSYIWLAASLFLKPFLRRGSISWCQWVGGIDFVLSLVCSVVQMQIAEAERYIFSIPIQLIYFANTLIILSIVANLLCIIALVHLQWQAIIGESTSVVVQESESERIVSVSPSPAEIDYDRIIAGVTASLQGPNTDPLVFRSLPQTSQVKRAAKEKN